MTVYRNYESYQRLDGRHVLIIILSIAAFVTNCMALGAICVIRRRLSANQTMMLSLCCADLLSAIGILGNTLVEQFYEKFSVPTDQLHAAICVSKIAKVCFHIVLTNNTYFTHT